MFYENPIQKNVAENGGLVEQSSVILVLTF